MDPKIFAELATILACSATLVGVVQIRHVEGRIAVGVGATLLFIVVVGRLALGV